MPSRIPGTIAAIVLGISCPVARGFAQNPVFDSALTLSRAIEAAESHAPRLKARASDVMGAREGVTLSRQLWLPSLDVGGQAARATDNNVTGTFFPQSIILPVSGPVHSTGSGTATYGSVYGAFVSWAPITFGRIGAQRRQADATLSLARDNLADGRFEERAQVSATFLDVLLARELVATQEHALARTQAAARAVRALAASGLRPGVDSLLAIADLSRAQVDLIAARRSASAAGSRLAELLGASEAPPLDGRLFLGRAPDVSTPPTLDLLAHPRLKPFTTQVAVSEAREAAAARLALPRLSLVASAWGRGSGIAADGSLDRSLSGGLSTQRTNSAVGLMLSLPVIDALFTGPRAGIDQARADADRFELAAQLDHARAQVTAADENVRLTVAAAREAPAQLAAATAGYQQMNSRYAAGLATLAELAQAQYQLARAEADAVVLRVAAWRAWLDQCVARGDLDPFLASIR